MICQKTQPNYYYGINCIIPTQKRYLLFCWIKEMSSFVSIIIRSLYPFDGWPLSPLLVILFLYSLLKLVVLSLRTTRPNHFLDDVSGFFFGGGITKTIILSSILMIFMRETPTLVPKQLFSKTHIYFRISNPIKIFIMFCILLYGDL